MTLPIVEGSFSALPLIVALMFQVAPTRIQSVPPGRRTSELLLRREPAVVFVDELLCVEPEVVRIRAEESFRVRRPGEDVEPLVLERRDVLRANVRVALDLRQLESVTQPRLTKSAAD